MKEFFEGLYDPRSIFLVSLIKLDMKGDYSILRLFDLETEKVEQLLRH